MAAKGSELVTLFDVAKTNKTQVGMIAEVLMRQNAILKDIPYMEMNEGTIHKEMLRSSLPSVYYRKANQAIPASKTTVEERTFQAAHFESKSAMDEAVAKRGGADRVGFNRWNQAQGHLQAMAIEHADLLLYGSPEDDNRKVAGLSDIYSTLDSSEEVSKQIIDGGGSGSDNCSIYKVHWGENAVFGVYPKGTQAGIKRTDRSEGGKLVQIAGLDENGNSGHFWGYEEQFEIDHGLVVKDYRQAARIANIDVSELQAGTGADLIDLMIDADFKIDNLENGQGVWYVNRTIEAFLYKQARAEIKAGGGLTFGNYQGENVLMFRGCPVRRVDSLLTSEAAVTA